MRGTVILVADDHSASISAVLGELAVAQSELRSDGVTLDVLVVDGGCIDDTVEIARHTAHELHLPFALATSNGSSAWSTQRDAFAHALKHGTPDFLVTLDPSGHHDARQLPDLIRSFRAKGSGLTIGSRWVRGGSAPGTSLPRSMLSRVASLLVARATGLRRVRDVTTSFRVIRPDTADLVTAGPASQGDYGYYCEFVAATQAYGFSVDEVPIVFRPRFTAVPRLRLADLTQFFADVQRIRGRIRSIKAEVAVDQSTWAARSGRMRGQAPDVGSEFGALDELTELSEAHHFTDWIVDTFEPLLGDEILEVGAGLGAIAVKIASRRPSATVAAIEPATNVFDTLVDRSRGVTNLSVSQITSNDLAAQTDHPTFDSVLYVNVLEHIEHDDDEISTAVRLLRPGGRLCIFVPAMPSLYGSLDYKSGHFRRYDAASLEAMLDRAGLVDVDVRYFDLLGVAPYWLMYRVLNVSRLDRASSFGYDRVVVPLSRAFQHILQRPPRGKNLIAIARRRV
jgi:SAM-dependent methyltransferase